MWVDVDAEDKLNENYFLISILNWIASRRYGHFSGINRKVQMKYQPKGRPRGSSSDDGNGTSNCTFRLNFHHTHWCLSQHIRIINRSICAFDSFNLANLFRPYFSLIIISVLHFLYVWFRVHPSHCVADLPKEPSLVLILKWGGELTPAGRIQAEELGRIFRCMYPGGQGRHDHTGTQGLGLLRYPQKSTILKKSEYYNHFFSSNLQSPFDVPSRFENICIGWGSRANDSSRICQRIAGAGGRIDADFSTNG